MSKDESAVIAEKLNEKNALENTVEAKPYYKYFTRYLLVILLVICFALSAALALLLHQSNQEQGVIIHQLEPLQSKFLQQSHLLETTQIITAILTNVNVNQLSQLNQNLSLQYKKLLLSTSSSQNKYKQWLTDNNASRKSIILIEDSFANNEQYRVETIVQIETLLNVIKIELATNNYDTKQQALLLNAQYQLAGILIKLQRLSIKSLPEDFQSLRASMAELLSADFPKELANRAKQNTKLMALVSGFTRLEDSVLKSGFFKKWQEQLSLINDYRNQLNIQQIQIATLIKNLAKIDDSKNVNIERNVGIIEKLLIQTQLPKNLFIIFSVVMGVIATMLWLLWLAIKYSSRHNFNHITLALESPVNVEDNSISPNSLKNKYFFYSEETYFLVNKIKHINNSRYSESDYVTLAKKKQQLENQQSKMVEKIEQLEAELVLVENNAKALSAAQLLLEQERYHALNTSAIEQLQLLGAIASSNSKQLITLNRENQDNYLFQAYRQGRDFIRRLRQITINRYLETDGAILTLSDVDIVALQQSILFNLSNEFALCNNQVSIEIDEKIQSTVNADAELFAEMFSVYIDLLCLEQKNCHLTLHVQLVDKNDGQQVLYFIGEIASQNNFAQLPEVLKYFSEEIEQNNELAKYFITLLSYQHGENINANLTDKGYQLSFNLPLAVTHTTLEESYPMITLPKCLPDIESLVKHLTSNSSAMPIEVLLAVKSPIQYQRIQQILQATGLQVRFVVNELMLAKYWKSGRFAVLITEINCSPFIEFNADYIVNSHGKTALLRGVFSFGELSVIEPDSANFADWVYGKLNIDSSAEELLLAMQPWLNINEKLTSSLTNNKQARANKKLLLAENIKNQSFNFHCYIQNQGSLELAIYMLNQYTQENSKLMAKLSHEFSSNHSDNVGAIIDRLTVNSRILSASHLLQLCNDWKVIISARGIDNSFQSQIALLKETQHAVNDINAYAKSMT